MLHGRSECAVAVRASLLADPPDAVAVEVPVTLGPLFRRAVSVLPWLTVVESRMEAGRLHLLPVTPQDGIAEAARTARGLGLPLACIDHDTARYPGMVDPVPDPAAIPGLGLAAYFEAVAPGLRRIAEDELRETAMASRLAALAARHARVVAVVGMAHVEGLRERLRSGVPPEPLGAVRPRGGSVKEIGTRTLETMVFLGEAPWQIAWYEHWRGRSGGAAPGRAEGVEFLLEEARRRYQAETGETVAPHALRLLARFARNLARLEGALVPDLVELVVAARGAVDENFGSTVLELATAYPHRSAGRLPEREITPEELEWLRTRSVRVHPRIREARPRPSILSLRRRPRETREGEWKDAWDPDEVTMCSYPPEDLVIEGEGRRLKELARGAAMAAGARSVPFTTSFLDGLDVRETVRRWHEGRIWVKSGLPGAAQVGSVVVLFEEDREKYTWEMTWYGEHAQESDLAFYATPPERSPVGPGVARCEYGGFLLSYPPRRLFDVWTDPWYQDLQDRGERLVAAAIEFSQEPMVAVIAPRPPNSRMRTLAERFGRRLVHLPLGVLSPTTRARVRVFHVLSSRRAREWAHRYVW